MALTQRIPIIFTLALLLMAGLVSPSNGVDDKVQLATEEILYRCFVGVLIGILTYIISILPEAK